MRKLDYIRNKVNKLAKTCNNDQDQLYDLIHNMRVPNEFHRSGDLLDDEDNPLIACCVYSGLHGSIIGVLVGHPYIDPEEDDACYWYEEFRFGKHNY